MNNLSKTEEIHFIITSAPINQSSKCLTERKDLREALHPNEGTTVLFGVCSSIKDENFTELLGKKSNIIGVAFQCNGRPISYNFQDENTLIKTVQSVGAIL